MKDFKLPERVKLDKVGETEISTVKLNSVGRGYETCLFYANGETSVFSQYDTVAEALATHERLVKHERAHLNVKMRISD